MGRIGYRKVKKHKPNFRQWLKARGEDDAGTSLFFHARLDSNAIAKTYDMPRQAECKNQSLLAESVRQIRAYEAAIERGDVETVFEYLPLDLTKEADRAYLKVQKKRTDRRLAEERR